jgi:hypothetical protein
MFFVSAGRLFVVHEDAANTATQRVLQSHEGASY